MKLDDEGHLDLTPRQLIDAVASDPARVVMDGLLIATPRVFATRSAYRRCLEAISSDLGIHPSAMVVRGSATLGFSIAPKPEKAWRKLSTGSDVDLAIVDTDLFHFMDSRAQQWQRRCNRTGLSKLSFPDLRKYKSLQKLRAYYCCRYFDLPDDPFVRRHTESLANLSEEPEFQAIGEVTAFYYRDWWAIQSRYEKDLRDLLRAVKQGDVAQPPDTPLPRDTL